MPATVVERIEAGMAGKLSDTPKPGDPIFERNQTIVIGDNRIAAEAACSEAAARGYHALLLSTFVEGEAREVAKLAVALGREVKASSHPLPRLPAWCWVGKRP